MRWYRHRRGQFLSAHILTSLVVFGLGLCSKASTASAAEPQDSAKKPPAITATSAPKNQRGLLVNDARACQGYTLFAPIMSTETYLIDMAGRVVRTWHSESSSALSTYLLENGHLLRHARLDQQVFGEGAGAGGHIQEFTWEGELVWDYRFATPKRLAHHDIFKMPNGNVLLISWEKKSAAEAIAAGRRPETVGNGQLLSEAIVEVKPTGKTTADIVWEWHVWDHLIQDHDSSKSNHGDVAAHPELIDVNFGEGAMASIVAKKEELDKLRAIGYVGAATPGKKPGPVRSDWLHVNAVAYNADLDQVMLNSPEFNEFWIIDHSTSKVEAAGHSGGRYGKGGDLLYRYGNPRAYRAGTIKDQKLYYEHNPHWIPKGLPGEGHVLVFNNGRRRLGGAYSSVDELVLPVDQDGRYTRAAGKSYGPEKPMWSYSAPKRSDFYAEFISGANRLPNGDTFICSGPSGTIFEVTPEKEIVWKYVNPLKPATASSAQVMVVLPPALRDTLDLTAEQLTKIDEFEKSSELAVAAILTAEQKEKLKNPPKGFNAGPPGGAPAAVRVLPGGLRQSLKLTAEQTKKVEELQKQAESTLDKILLVQQKQKINDIRAGFVNTFGAGAGAPPSLGNAVFRSYRYAANYPGLAGKDLTPGKVIEE